MKKLTGLAFALVLLSTTPAFADVTVSPAAATAGDVPPDGAGEATAAADVDPDDDAEHGTDTLAFLTLLVGGAAPITALAVMMGRKRIPV